MKLAIPATGPALDSVRADQFGRCAYFLVVDLESGAVESLPNPAQDAAGGAGTRAAQLLLDQGVELVLAERVGPKAAAVLEAGHATVREARGKTCREVLEDHRTHSGANAP